MSTYVRCRLNLANFYYRFSVTIRFRVKLESFMSFLPVVETSANKCFIYIFIQKVTFVIAVFAHITEWPGRCRSKNYPRICSIPFSRRLTISTTLKLLSISNDIWNLLSEISFSWNSFSTSDSSSRYAFNACLFNFWMTVQAAISYVNWFLLN